MADLYQEELKTLFFKDLRREHHYNLKGIMKNRFRAAATSLIGVLLVTGGDYILTNKLYNKDSNQGFLEDFHQNTHLNPFVYGLPLLGSTFFLHRSSQYRKKEKFIELELASRSPKNRVSD